MSYASTAARANATVARKGAAVTFTKASPGTMASDGSWSGASTTTVTGNAIRVKGNPKVYAALELIETEAPTLFFTPTTYGQLPALNATVSWNSTTYTVRDVSPVAPDGTAICARVVVAK